MGIGAEAKLKARQVVQDTFSLPAVFYETSASNPAAEDAVNVRLHDKSKAVGDLAGTNLSYAEVMERPTRLTFSVPEIETRGYVLARGSIAVMYDYANRAVGFYVDNVHPRDGNTQTVDVSQMGDDLAGLLLPDGEIFGVET